MVRHIAHSMQVTPAEGEWIMLVVMRYVRQRLLEDTSVSLPGIGTFAVAEGAARLGRNPHTGEPIPLPPRRTVRLRMAKTFKKALAEKPNNTY